MTSQIKRWKEDFDVATAENWLDAMFGRGKMRFRDEHIPVTGKNCKVFGKSRSNLFLAGYWKNGTWNGLTPPSATQPFCVYSLVVQDNATFNRRFG